MSQGELSPFQPGTSSHTSIQRLSSPNHQHVLQMEVNE